MSTKKKKNSNNVFTRHPPLKMKKKEKSLTIIIKSNTIFYSHPNTQLIFTNVERMFPFFYAEFIQFVVV